MLDGKAKTSYATVSTVIEYIKVVSSLVIPNGSTHVFRGQKSHIWKPRPGILRPNSNIVEHEREIIRELISIHPQEFSGDRSMFDRLVRMQHFGLPTRLMDVSLNPLVALYFATEPFGSKLKHDGQVFAYKVPKQRRRYYDSDTVACIANLANLSDDEKQSIIDARGMDQNDFNHEPFVDRLIQFIKEEKSHFRAEIQRTHLLQNYYVVPKMNNRRILAQSGAFIIFGLEDDQRRGPVRYPISPERIVVPHDSKHSVRQELEKLGINESTMFPELDRAASYIVKRFS